jgi:soluble lytic murein transglycosylase
MRCESSNQPDAVSEAGAIGLMQIMPDTGTWIAHKLDMDDVYTVDLLYDPETSIAFACWYLRFLTGRFDGNVMQIVAAYNAGHGSVEGWLEDERFSAGGELTSIPFDQTARYYEKVMTAYENYTTLYPEQFSADAAGAVEAE